jgi:eukaryotic-like serine/threonine-protein kinase
MSAQPEIPIQIGRFEILRELGQGAQGAVYLARDPHLERQVAIKTLHLDQDSGANQDIKTLLAEARIVSQFQHPNIVTVYDAGEHDGNPYLVFEYVEGTTLASLLRKQRNLPPSRAVEIAVQILDGVSYAHQKNIVHRDLKPANIILDTNGVPRIMDFGIARQYSGEKTTRSDVIGTPFYMAPEYIQEGIFGPRSDIFSVGMILYELLTGTTAVRGSSVSDVLDRMINQTFMPPSGRKSEVSEQLDSIVLKALAKKPEDRFEQAEAMKLALNRYLHPDEEGSEQFQASSAQSTLDFLLRRMRHKSDFPALSKTISDINKIVSSDRDGSANLAKVILKDFALTNKLLKMVNTAVYGQFGSTISTISRAVVILGFENIRNAAITLLLFDHLQNKAQAGQLVDETIATFFNGLIARSLASKYGIKDGEEAFICSMFYNLGRLLATFYFYEETLEINKLMEQKNMSEAHASQMVLGISYEELGTGIARAWHFPDQIIHSMRQVGEGTVRKAGTEQEKLRVMAGLSNELSKIAANTPVAERGKELAKLIGRYGESMPLNEKHLISVMEDSLEEIARHASVLNIAVKKSQFLNNVSVWSGHEEAAEKTGQIPGEATSPEANSVLENTVEKTMLKMAPKPGQEEASEAGTPSIDPSAVLAAGIQDITNSLVGDCTLNDLLRMILETMYRAMGFSRVLVCVRDRKANVMQGRFGFGQDIDAAMKAFKFPLDYTPDVFHVALAKGADIMIADINADSIKDRIPAWYRDKVGAHSFMIFPILVDKAPIAMIYADQDKEAMLIDPKELNMLKTMRNQAVLAIKQKR